MGSSGREVGIAGTTEDPKMGVRGSGCQSSFITLSSALLQEQSVVVHYWRD
jgi:hypothetical protein